MNEYPAQVDYKINTDSWVTVTTNLGPGTTSITIPASSFIQGSNTFQFEESNSYSTKFEWLLYMNQGSTPETYITTFTYDTYKNLASITDSMGNTTCLAYDTQYHVYLTSITNALNQTKTATYDFTTGNVTSLTDAKGYTTFYQYDSLGRITKKIDPDLTEKEALYNDLNNTVILYDELDHKTIHYYDGLNRVTKTEWYITDTTFVEGTYTYNYMSKPRMRTDPGGHVYLFEYDS